MKQVQYELFRSGNNLNQTTTKFEFMSIFFTNIAFFT